MHRKLIRRYLPHHDEIRGHKHLSWLGSHLHDPNLWHLNRRSVSGAFAVGLFCAFIPVPFQMVIAALVAIVARVNLPLSVVLVWITNPLTMGPIFFFAYTVGTWILDKPILQAAAELEGIGWWLNEIQAIWKPLLVGSFVCGTLSAVIGYFGVRASWRLHLARRWKARGTTRKSST